MSLSLFLQYVGNRKVLHDLSLWLSKRRMWKDWKPDWMRQVKSQEKRTMHRGWEFGATCAGIWASTFWRTEENPRGILVSQKYPLPLALDSTLLFTPLAPNSPCWPLHWTHSLLYLLKVYGNSKPCFPFNHFFLVIFITFLISPFSVSIC